MASKNTQDLAGILLIGDVNKVFADTEEVNQSACEICADMLDGIEKATTEKYHTIGVVISGNSGKLASAVKSLRQANEQAKIILLAQMYEEPVARELSENKSGQVSPADDYLICPLSFSEFLSGLSRLRERRGDSVSIPTGVKQRASVPKTEVGDETPREREEVLEKLATQDELTGLKNRRYIFEFCRQILERANKENSWVTILIFDIDDFKHYNDVYGHPAGDKILKQASVLMRRSCRSHDIVGRIGGDEFAVVFWDNKSEKATADERERRSTKTEHPKEALFIAERFRREFNNSELDLLGPDGKGVLTISGGLASFPRDASNVQELFERADEALLEAKRSGKNRIYLVGEPDNDISEIE